MMILALLPAFNEEAALPHLLSRFKEVRRMMPTLEVLAVNDGSTDRTGAVLDEYAACNSWLQVIHHARNRGLAAALRTGFHAAAFRLSPGDTLVTMDADDTHDPAQIPDLVSALNQADVAVASRYCANGRTVGLGPMRRLLSFGAVRFLALSCPVEGVRDYSSGYRAYRASVVRRLVEAYPDIAGAAAFDCTAEVLLRCACLGAVVGEVPLLLRNDRRLRRSHMPFLRTIFGYCRLAWLYHTPLRQRIAGI